MSGRSPPLYFTLTLIAMQGHQKDINNTPETRLLFGVVSSKIFTPLYGNQDTLLVLKQSIPPRSPILVFLALSDRNRLLLPDGLHMPDMGIDCDWLPQEVRENGTFGVMPLDLQTRD